MDLGNALAAEHSKAQTSRIVAWVGRDPQRFAALLAFVTGPDRRLAQRAAWPLSHCVQDHPRLAHPHLERMLQHLKTPGLHPAIRRNTFRLLEEIALPESLHGLATELSLAALANPEEPVAVKVYAMTVLKRLIGSYPELEFEVRALIDEQKHRQSPAFFSRVRRLFGPRAADD